MAKKCKKSKLKIKVLAIIFIVIAIFSIVAGSIFTLVSLNKSDKVEEELPIVDETPTTEESENYETSATFIAVGDALIHSAIYYDALSNGVYDFNYIFTEVKPIIEKYDLKYYNQETILGGTSLGLSSYPLFNSPQEVGDAFMNMGFNLVSLATNHTLDYGERGMLSSLEYWGKQEGVIAAGSYESEESRTTPRIMEVNGITYTLLSYSTLTNGLRIPYGKEYLFNLYDEEKVKEDIERVRDKVDVVMVAMHWGAEYTHTPVQEERQIANYLASLGVDIVIGTHPHVIQPIDFIDDTMVIYSLGNFVSGQIGIERLVGLMASVTIKKTVTDGVATITLEDPAAELVYTRKAGATYGSNYKLYPFSKLDDTILPGYQKYYEQFMSIATNGSREIRQIGY